MLRNLRMQRRSLGEERASTPTVDAAPTSAERPAGVGAQSPFDRARRTILKPTDASWEAFEQWLEAIGEPVDDLDWLSELYLTTCEVNGWSLPSAEAPTPIAEPLSPVTSPPAVAENEHSATRADPVTIVVKAPAAKKRRPKLKPKQAADLFIAWVRDNDRCGTYSNQEFTDLCAEFFATEGLEPLTDNILRPALETMKSDVMKARSDSGVKGGTRRRHFKWTILEAETAETVAPWTELPMAERRVA